jgi:hypothetical protein
VAAARQQDVGGSLAAARRRQWQRQRLWRQRDSATAQRRRWRQRASATSAKGWRGHGRSGSVSGGGGGAQRDGGAADDDTADADGNGDANDIIC